MAEVMKYRTMNMNISFEKEFMGGNILSEPSVIINAVKNPDYDVAFAFVQFFFDCNSMSDDFVLKSQMGIAYQISPLKDIQGEDLYKCVQLSQITLQNILNETFSGQKNKLLIPEIPYSAVSETIDEQMQNLRQ